MVADHVFIIAEIGINHNGDLQLAKQLMRMAADAGCDAVKFQKRSVDIVYTKEFLDSPRVSPWGMTQREQKEHLEFGQKEYEEIDRTAAFLGIAWSASAWDIESYYFLRQFKCSFNKVASPMLTHTDLLEAVARDGKMTFISTGMSTIYDIDQAVSVFRRHCCPFTLMHCISEYPAHESKLNLNCIRTLQHLYGCPVGYSGHEVSVIPSVLAAMLGAVAIERHITLDRSMYGSDQSASLEKRGLELMVKYIRTIPVVMGDGIKTISGTELDNASKLRYAGTLYGNT